MRPIGTAIECPACGSLTTLPYLCRACWVLVSPEERERFYASAMKGGGWLTYAMEKLVARIMR